LWLIDERFLGAPTAGPRRLIRLAPFQPNVSSLLQVPQTAVRSAMIVSRLQQAPQGQHLEIKCLDPRKHDLSYFITLTQGPVGCHIFSRIVMLLLVLEDFGIAQS
jgi:hypothetical protein